MQTLKIEIPNGYEIDSFDKAVGEIKFKPKPKEVTARIKTIDDVLRELGDRDKEVIIYDKLITVLTRSSHIVNYQLAVMITKALNEGWVPDWSNSSEYKYYAWFDMKGSSGFRFDDYAHWNSYSYVGSRLCFKSGKLAEHAGKQFTEIYKQFMVIE